MNFNMTIAAFNFTRILAEKKGQGKGRVDINSNIALASVDEIDFVMGDTKKKGLKIGFEYRNSYTQDIGTLVITGEVLFLSDQKTHDKELKMWGKDKKLSQEVMIEVFDMVSVRSTIQAIQLSSTVGLPPPVPLPRFQKDAQTSSQKPVEKKTKK
jgi:hypothetical protein